MPGLYPLSRMQQLDANGELLVGARLFLFDGGTTTPRVGYRDSSLTTEHPNPIIADSQARIPLIFLDDGYYRQRLTTATGVLVFDDDGIPVLSATGGGGPGTSVDPTSVFGTRDIKIRFDDQPIDGYVRLNGRTIGSAASGATERANTDTQPLYEELWSFANIVVPAGKGASGPADFVANKQLQLPNMAGRGIFGADDMGATPQNVLTTAVLGMDSTKIGSYGGSQQVTIAQANLPNYTLTGGTSGTFTVSGDTGTISNTHTHDISSGGVSVAGDHAHSMTTSFAFNATQAGSNFSSLSNVGGAANLGTTSNAGGHSHTLSGSTSTENLNHHHPFTWSGVAPGITIGSGGSGTATTNLPPIMTFMIYIRL